MEIDVEKIAELAKLELNEEEKERYKKELIEILKAFEKIRNLPDGEEEIPSASGERRAVVKSRNSEEIAKNFARRKGFLALFPEE